MINKTLLSFAVTSVLVLTSHAALSAPKGGSNAVANGKPFQQLNALITENRVLIEANAEDISALKSEVSDINTRIGSIETRLASVSDQIENNTTAISNAFERIVLAEGNIEALREDLSLIAQQHGADMVALQAQLDAVDTELVRLADESAGLAGALDTRVAELRAQMTDNTNGIEALLADVLLLNANLTSINANYNQLSNAQGVLQAQMDTYQQQVANLDSALHALKARVDTFHSPCLDVIDIGQSIHGELLQDGSCLSDVRSWSGQRNAVMYYSFTVAESTAVTINLEGAPNGAGTLMDPHLFLHVGGSDGAVIAADDDSGYGYNARIMRTLAPGTYTIEVSDYWYTHFGTYRVSVH